MPEEKKTCYYKCDIGNCVSSNCGTKCSCKSTPKEDNWPEQWFAILKALQKRAKEMPSVEYGKQVEYWLSCQTVPPQEFLDVLASQKKELAEKVKEFATYSRGGKYWNAEVEKAYQAGVSTMENKMLSYLSDTK